jgi:pilus assembly protein Flp/PilA
VSDKGSPILYRKVGWWSASRTWKKGGTCTVLAFFRDDEGQGLVEYALIIAVIAIAVIVAMIFLRGQLQNIFSNIGNNLT